MMKATDHLPEGGGFLLTGWSRVHIFTPEDFSSEQRQIGDTTEEFVKREILPELDRLEEQDFTLVVDKMRKCAGQGLFLADVPEVCGGLELEKTTSMLIAEKMGSAGSFAITYGGQTGIGSLPLVYYGTRAQQGKYLERLTSGEWIAAYCLTEPDCGSDPLSARTSAVLTTDGRHYILNGVKQFITNAAFADLFTVFAKIDGQHFSAFLVEREFAGLSIGPEEKKMGLKGSSTAQVVLEDVLVPVENLLGEPGKGHKIAFNVLNIGRLKVAATVCGTAKTAFSEGARYAGERKQFGRVIGDFGAIREKLADMTAEIFTAESVVYRIAGLLDDRIALLDRSDGNYRDLYQKSIEEYAGECAIAKVFCTEVLAHVVDEVLQIHGGYGFVCDYPAERYYRDERINRIFEGTNEINRILIPTLFLRRGGKNEFPLAENIHKAKAHGWPPDTHGQEKTPFANELLLTAGLKHLLLLSFGALAVDEDFQEAQIALADMVTSTFALESVLLRAEKHFPNATDERKALLEAVVKVAAFQGSASFHLAANRFSAYALSGSPMITFQQTVSHLAAYPGEGLLKAKKLLAETAKASGKYPL